jgi:hypothetical protein
VGWSGEVEGKEYISRVAWSSHLKRGGIEK